MGKRRDGNKADRNNDVPVDPPDGGEANRMEGGEVHHRGGDDVVWNLRKKYGLTSDDKFDKFEHNLFKHFRRGMAAYWVQLLLDFLLQRLGSKTAVAEFLGFKGHHGFLHIIRTLSVHIDRIAVVLCLQGDEIRVDKHDAILAGYTAAVNFSQQELTGDKKTITAGEIEVLIEACKNGHGVPAALEDWLDHVLLALSCIPKLEA